MQIDKIKATYNAANDDESFILKRIFRPASFYLTWLYMKIGIRSADTVNLIGLVLGFTAVLFVWFGWIDNGVFYGDGWDYRIAVSLYLLYLITDQCDGNLARITKTTSYRGKFIDGAIDVFVDGLLFAGIGYHAQMYVEGSIAFICFSYAMFLVNRFSFFGKWIECETGQKHVNPLLRVIWFRNFEMNERILMLLAMAVLYPLFAVKGFCSAIILRVSIALSVWIIFNVFMQTHLLNVSKKSRLISMDDDEEIKEYLRMED